MKKTIGISLFIFFAIVAAILVAGLVFFQNNKNSNNTNAVVPNKATSNTILNLNEISKHKSFSYNVEGIDNSYVETCELVSF